MNLCEVIDSLCSDIVPYLKETKHGIVELRRVGLPVKCFIPLDPASESSCGLALRAAVVEANTTPTIKADVYLLMGRYEVANGFHLRYFAPAVTNLTLFFSGSSAIIYKNYRDAGKDYMFYKGIRNPVNFGAYPGLNQTNAVDAWDAFMACKFSFPPYGAAGTIVDEKGEDIRYGEAHIPEGTYRMSKPFFQQAGQHWIGSYRTFLLFGTGIASSAPSSPANRVYAWDIARSIYNGSPSANFTHDCKLIGVDISAEGSNDYLSGLRWGSAQHSEVGFVKIYGLASGLTLHPLTGTMWFHDMSFDYISGRVGPPIIIPNCNTLTFDRMSIVHFNTDGLKLDTNDAYNSYNSADGGYMPGVRINNSFNIHVNQINAEDLPRGARITQSRGCQISMDHIFYTTPDLPNKSSVDIADQSYENRVSVNGNKITNLIREDTGSGYKNVYPGDASGNWIPGNYAQGLAKFNAISTASRTSTINPVAGDLSEGQSIVWRNTTIPEVRVWTKLEGVLYKSPVWT